MNCKKILSALIISLILGASVVLNVSAVTISTGSGTVEITNQVDSVSCSAMTSPAGTECLIIMADGTRHTAKYPNAEVGPNPDAEWYENDIKTKLVADGLMDAEAGTSSGGTDTEAEGGGTDETADPVEERCTSILPPSWCTEDGAGIAGILNLVLNIMTAGMGILATIGLVISGIQWLTARDKEDQVVKAKSRIFNIVIGIMVWGIMWLVLQWLLPGGINLEIGAII